MSFQMKKLKKGRSLLLLGWKGPYPAGYILGVVTSVEDVPSKATKEAQLQTPLDFLKLDYIYVLRGQ